MALTIPIFILVLVGTLEYGYYFYAATSATSAAREGARQCTLVALGKCGDCKPTAAVDYMKQIGLGSFTQATANCTSGANGIMYAVNVVVDYPTLSGLGTKLGMTPRSSIAGHTVAYGMATMRGQ